MNSLTCFVLFIFSLVSYPVPPPVPAPVRWIPRLPKSDLLVSLPSWELSVWFYDVHPLAPNVCQPLNPDFYFYISSKYFHTIKPRISSVTVVDLTVSFSFSTPTPTPTFHTKVISVTFLCLGLLIISN